jgi:hypothetical protein
MNAPITVNKHTTCRINRSTTASHHRPPQIIADPASLVAEGPNGYLRQKLTSGFIPFVGFFFTGLNFRLGQPKSSETK